MIKTTELRVGNIVLYTQDNDQLPVLKIDGDSKKVCLDLLLGLNMEVNEQDIDPIPLTPEWLERLDFAIETIPDTEDDEGDIIPGYTHWTNGKCCFHFEDGMLEHREHVNSVHMFQNWYYYTIGEELTIKEA
jgi:hypothetical protein